MHACSSRGKWPSICQSCWIPRTTCNSNNNNVDICIYSLKAKCCSNQLGESLHQEEFNYRAASVLFRGTMSGRCGMLRNDKRLVMCHQTILA
jgi:hypothetical protein